MGVLILPRRFSQQPQQLPAIDGGNAITQGLVFAAIPQGATFANAVNGQRGTLSGASIPTPANAVSGRNLLFNGGSSTNSYLDFGTTDKYAADIALGPSTWFFWAAPTGQGGLAERNDNNSVNAGWFVGIDSALKLKFLKEFSGINLTCESTTALTSGVYTSFAVTYDGSGTGAGSVLFYLGGAQDTTSPINSGSGSAGSDAANNLYLGRASFAGAGNSGSGSLPGNLEFAAFFKRVLSPSEIRSLHQNRYQVFKAPQRKIWVTGASADVTLAITGNAGTAAIGNLGASDTLSGQADGIGNAATGSVGSVTPTTGVTGNTSTSAVGSVAPAMTIGLTGNAATSAVGTLAPVTALTGNAATSAVGSVTPATALTGNAATGAVGSMTPSSALAVTGDVGTTAVGTLAPTFTLGVTGNTGTAAIGSVAPTNALAGNAATSAVGSVAPSMTLGLTGNAATGAVGTVLPSANVTVALTGVAGTAAVGFTALVATLGLTGNIATGNTGILVPTTTLPITGNGATTAVGSIVYITGQTAALTGNGAVTSVGTMRPARIVRSKALFVRTTPDTTFIQR